MATPPLNLTNAFRTQKRVISYLPPVDYNYIIGETLLLAEQIKKSASENRLQEKYTIYLYGKNFLDYSRNIENLISSTLGSNGITGYRLNSSSIGTTVELATYPTLAGLKVVISTIN